MPSITWKSYQIGKRAREFAPSWRTAAGTVYNIINPAIRPAERKLNAISVYLQLIIRVNRGETLVFCGTGGSRDISNREGVEGAVQRSRGHAF